MKTLAQDPTELLAQATVATIYQLIRLGEVAWLTPDASTLVKLHMPQGAVDWFNDLYKKLADMNKTPNMSQAEWESHIFSTLIFMGLGFFMEHQDDMQKQFNVPTFTPQTKETTH